MTETTTAGKLTEGSRILADCGEYGEPIPAKTGDQAAEVATLTAEPEKRGRKLFVQTDRGTFEIGPTAKVVLAPPAEPEPAEKVAAEPTPTPEDAVPPPAGILAATVNLDGAGRLTADSVLHVGEAATVVRPETGDNAPARLLAALAELGYEPVTRWALKDGTAVCQARPIHP
ncbi:hypothetical protein [Micromonospora sp. NPDC047730]|uniref:hypothetical protein n=1 Tax=Micromonospora sp. NPDC047730 TaxID=3364253 RepID=UPI0037146D70